jgi:hypothetical protein
MFIERGSESERATLTFVSSGRESRGRAAPCVFDCPFEVFPLLFLFTDQLRSQETI